MDDRQHTIAHSVILKKWDNNFCTADIGG